MIRAITTKGLEEIVGADQQATAVDGETEQAGGAAASMKYLKNPTKEPPGGQKAP